MASSINTLLVHAAADRAVDLLRLSSGEMRRINPLLNVIGRDILRRIVDSNLSAGRAAMLSAVLGDVRALVSSGYAAVAAEHATFLLNLGQLESGWVAGTINDLIGISVVEALSPGTVLRNLVTDDLILGAPSSDWWARQSGSLTFRFAQQMRTGIAQGETNGDLIARVRGNADHPGLMDVSRREAEALVRTSAQTVAHHARLETFRANADIIKGVQQQSTLDNRTSDICIAYDGAAWDLDGEPINGTKLPFNGGPPRHWNCRSVLVPVMKSYREMGWDTDFPLFEPKTRASMDGEVAAKTTFNDWFSSRSEEQQNKILGTGRAELYRAGKLRLNELLDQRGRPLPLRALGGG